MVSVAVKRVEVATTRTMTKMERRKGIGEDGIPS
jgi:hypothetical protein